jgi:leader peptidase (prepilin peptidase)/N-methyltransferase
MEYFMPVIIFLFGTVIGSFLNVVIFRHNSGRTFGGRSGCMTCARTLEWYELVPLFSYFFQGGKCGKCRTPISFMYPVVEFAMGAIALLLVARFSFFLPHALGDFLYYVLFYALAFAVMLVIAGYDLRHKIVPNNLVYPLMVIAFFGLFFSDNGYLHFHAATLASIAAGPLVALPLFALWAISKGEWLGFGDVKLAVAIGLLLGTSRGFAALVLSFWIGAVIGVAILAAKGKLSSRKMQIPFAPFLVIGTLVAFFFDVTVVDLLHIFG